ncbi:MAG: inorganic phosphate transporter, partial [Myxococcota bacterium]
MGETLFGLPALLVLAAGLALYMAWAIGANDVANAMGTSVGSGALTLRRAILVAAVFEFAGAFLAGGHVTDTIRKGIVDPTPFVGSEHLFAYGMLAALASAGTWLLVATRFGWPVSTTHSIVGAIVGVGLVVGGDGAVNWPKIAQIVLSWLTSPVVGGMLAFGIFVLTRRMILDTENPVRQARRYGPFFFFWVFFVLGLVTLFKGLKNLNLDFGFGASLGLAFVLGLVGAGIGVFFLRHVRLEHELAPDSRFAGVERLFAVLQVLTACAVAFAHGSNDVANAIGPLAAVANTVNTGSLEGKAPLEPWMLAVGGLG